MAAPYMEEFYEAMDQVEDQRLRLYETSKNLIIALLKLASNIDGKHNSTRRKLLENVRTVDLNRMVSCWTAMEKIATAVASRDVSSLCKKAEQAVGYALDMDCARLLIKYITAHYIDHDDVEKCRPLIDKCKIIAFKMEIVVKKFMGIYTLEEMIAASHILVDPGQFITLSKTLDAPLIKEVSLTELRNSEDCKDFRDKLAPETTILNYLKTAPSGGYCAYCTVKTILAGVDFVFVDSCKHIYCEVCIAEFFNEPADSFCVINSCRKPIRHYIKRTVYEDYKEL